MCAAFSFPSLRRDYGLRIRTPRRFLVPTAPRGNEEFDAPRHLLDCRTSIIGITDCTYAAFSFPPLRVGMKCLTLRVTYSIVERCDYGLQITDYGFAHRAAFSFQSLHRDYGFVICYLRFGILLVDRSASHSEFRFIEIP